MKSKLGRVHNGDCIEGMKALPKGSVDLVFADPPFNIGYKYDVYEDKMAVADYLKWSNAWMKAAHRALKPDGTFWLAIGDDFAAELKIEAQKIGFHCRSWVIWYYTFGVNCKNKFTRSHTHLFHFVKNREKFTFRDSDMKNRVPSARALVYADKRAKGNGRLPDDTWIIPPANGDDADYCDGNDSAPASCETFSLRPQELQNCFQPTEDTWYIPRVAGTFKERAGFHGCQMPEQLLARIIRVCSEENDIVMDPFSGSASTLVVARKLGRRPIGFELSARYTQDGQARLDATCIGDTLDGSPEPTMEAFQEAGRQDGNSLKSRRQKSADFAQAAASEIAAAETARLYGQDGALERGLVEAFKTAHNGFSVDVLLADPDLNAAFVDECQRIGIPGNPRLWNHRLLRIRKRTGNGMSGVHSQRRFSMPFSACEPFLFASEAAWKTLINEERAESLDEILCDPHLAMTFDGIAHEFAPGFSSLQYRWGALRIRKDAKWSRTEGLQLDEVAPKRMGPRVPVDDIASGRIPHSPGIYRVADQRDVLFIGGAFDVCERLSQILESNRRTLWSAKPDTLFVQSFQTSQNVRDLMGWTSCFLKRNDKLPKFNIPDLRAST
ncbi:MAG: site-specific DNA-methyltransferase [Planctomycetaceae bacterium]